MNTGAVVLPMPRQSPYMLRDADVCCFFDTLLIAAMPHISISLVRIDYRMPSPPHMMNSRWWETGVDAAFDSFISDYYAKLHLLAAITPLMMPMITPRVAAIRRDALLMIARCCYAMLPMLPRCCLRWLLLRVLPPDDARHGALRERATLISLAVMRRYAAGV